MRSSIQGLQDFKVLDLLASTCSFNAGDKLRNIHLMIVQNPPQEKVVFYFLETFALSLMACKEDGGDWKTLRLMMSASDLSVENGQKFYNPMHAIESPARDFLKQALGGSPLPPGVKSVDDLTIDDALGLITGALLLEQARAHGILDTQDLINSANGDNEGLINKLKNNKPKDSYNV